MFTDIYHDLFLAMFILLAATTVSLVSAKRRLAGWLNLAFVAAASVLLLHIGVVSIFSGAHAVAHKVNVASFAIPFMVDGVSGLFIAIISLMALMSAFYSIEYMAHYHEYRLWSYYLNFPLFILGMIGIVTVDDLSLGFTAAWQLMTLTSFFLIRFENKQPAIRRAAFKYLVLMELAWVSIVAGAFFISGAAACDSLHELSAKLAATQGWGTVVVPALLLAGFAMKAGVFPLGQMWLPDAHSIAPSPVSALLSGVMIKTGIYGIVRTFFWMLPVGSAHGFAWGVIIATIGVVTLFIGTVQAMKQSDAKRLLAYSSIGQIGYIVFAVGAALFMLHSSSAYVRMFALVVMVGALYHVLNHAMFKGLLFLTSGSVLHATGTKDLNKLGGLIQLMPVTAVVAGIASLSISGIPPFSGFASKWTIISATLLAGSEVLFLAIFAIVALFTSAITLACYVKFFGMTFTSSGSQWNTITPIKEVPVTMLLPKVVLAVFCLVQGLVPAFYFNTIAGVVQHAESAVTRQLVTEAKANGVQQPLLGVAISPGSGNVAATAVPAAVLMTVLLAFAVAWLLKKAGGAEDKVAPTWMCGYQDLHNLTRYRNKSMFSALKKLLWWTGGNVNE